MKIIIAGAGIGGMYAAEKLGKLGFDVTVYEKAKSLSDMRFDWHDDVAPKIFRRLGLPIIDEHFKKRSWTFVTPFEKHLQPMVQDESDPDLSMERRPLNQMLYDRAAAFAKFEFGKTVTAPVMKDGRVCGVVADGEEILGDLVIDCAGAYSQLRRNLPRELGVTEIADHERFVAYRAFVRRPKDSPDPQYTNKVYLKHLGGAGLSWAILDHDPTVVNVLIGRVNTLPDTDREVAFADLMANNPIVSPEVVRGGFNVVIPVRYPATKFVSDGYAALGDSAYMTIPMLGSGIASTLLAADFLCENIADGMTKGKKAPELFNVERLWKYQTACYREFGAAHCGVDVMKRWLLTAQDDFILWAFKQGIIDNDDLQISAAGGTLKLSVGQMLSKLKKAGLKRVPVLLKINTVLNRCKKAERIGKQIPKNYNDGVVKKWERRLKTLFEKGDIQNAKANEKPFII